MRFDQIFYEDLLLDANGKNYRPKTRMLPVKKVLMTTVFYLKKKIIC